MCIRDRAAIRRRVESDLCAYAIVSRTVGQRPASVRRRGVVVAASGADDRRFIAAVHGGLRTIGDRCLPPPLPGLTSRGSSGRRRRGPKSAAAHVVSTAWFLEGLRRAVFGEWLAESDVAVVFRAFSPGDRAAG